MNSSIYPVCYARETIRAEFSIPEASWYYHSARFPQPDVELSGWQWYSATQMDKLRQFWAARPSVKRRLVTKAVSAGE